MKPFAIKTIALIAGAIVFIACKQNANNTDKGIPKHDILLSESENVKFIISQNGKAKQVASAKLAQQFQTPNDEKYTIFPKGIYVETFTDSAKLESTLSAKKARMKDDESFYSAYDSVVVTNYISNRKIETDTLFWNREEHKIYNKCFTKFFLENVRFDALNGMDALEDLSDYEIRTIREGDMTFEKTNKQEQDTTQQIQEHTAEKKQNDDELSEKHDKLKKTELVK